MLARRPLKYDRLRLLDLHLLFPEFARDIRLPRSAVPWRTRLKARANEYWSTCDRLLLFRQMGPIQKCALVLLEATGLVSQDPVSREWSLVSEEHPIVTEAVERNQGDEVVAQFLAEVLLPMQLTGPQGLKARTGLLEWRYDEV